MLGLGEETLAEVGVLTKQMEQKNPEKEKLDPGDVTGLLGHAHLKPQQIHLWILQSQKPTRVRRPLERKAYV